jgi:hypothetical protein
VRKLLIDLWGVNGFVSSIETALMPATNALPGTRQPQGHPALPQQEIRVVAISPLL